MAQKFTSLEDAATQLGVSKDLLGQLREAGKVRAYRDGTSWKFRAEDIDKLESEGLPELDPGASDLSLDLADELPPKGPAAAAPAPESDLSLDDDDLGLAPEPAPAAAAGGESDLSLDTEAEEIGSGPASDLSLDDVDEPTVAGLDEGSSDALALGDDDSIDLNTDSILMSEAELGAPSNRPPSTIIGKADLDLDADLDLSPLDRGAGPASDVKLASESGVVPIEDDELSLDLPSPSGSFEGLEELEVDLEAESSRILSPEDVAKAQGAAKKAAESKSGAISDLDLAPIGSSGSIDIGGSAAGESNVGLSGLSALELEDDSEVLGEGSDVTLSGESSGINIISPSDSGLALDEVPLDLSGSAPIGSSLDLGNVSGVDIAQPSGIGSALGLGSGIGLESKAGEDFQLTPLGEDDVDDEKDSSQVIALDELSEEAAPSPAVSGFVEEGMEDFGAIGTPGLAPGAVPVGAATVQELPFSIWNVLSLGGCIMLLGLCAMMTFDLLRTMWSWDGVSRINSSLLEVLNPFLGK